ncbi:cytochrome P450 [Streptomyces sp. NBC_00091]|uniref:cytochrome P450 n=1 Tax=Streptomyces sp. NBC_00091 TaxID=2975648 RepID=UPI00224D74BD|nr:cytochrome P450 [Streptomyces sp. NBC_00091]MCX5380396.1 cytochrome P450 [Streptomyces sp. NBC_00091]
MPSATDRYDPLAAEILRDPYPVLAELREREPVFWHEGMDSWGLTRYADCVRVLRDHETFARDPRRTGGTVPVPSLSVQTLDPPRQSRVRSLFMSALRAQDLGAVEERARLLVLARLGELAGAGPFDVVAEIAVPLSVAVVADLLGVEAPPYGEFAAVSDAIMRSMDGGLNPALVEPGRVARRQLSDLVDSWFAASARPGLLARVRQATVRDSDALTRLYVKNTARVMFQGGYSTLAAAVGNAVHTLLAHPGALHQMRGRTLLATGADELVRFDGPVQGTTRTAVRACRIGTVHITPGQKVVPLFAAANRDPAAFTRADELVLDRTPNRHLGYGWGPHSCIGTSVAQAGLRALIAALNGHPARPAAAGEGVRRRTATMRAFDTLPAVLLP